MSSENKPTAIDNAKALLNSGRIADAQKVLLEIIKSNPQDKNAWALYVNSLSDQTQKIIALEQCVQFNPGNEKANQVLDRLKSKRSKLNNLGETSSQNQPSTSKPYKSDADLSQGRGIASAPNTTRLKTCPFCAEQIQEAATVCRFCGRELVYMLALEKKQQDILKMSVANYQAAGWITLSYSAKTAQLKKAKEFNWGIFILGLFFLQIFALVYLIYYVVQGDEIVTLSIDDEGYVVENGKRQNGKRRFSKTPKEIHKSNKTTLIILFVVAIFLILCFALLLYVVAYL